MDKVTIDTYDELAKEYDDETIDFWVRFPDTVVTRFAEEVGGDKMILDVGSGPGRDGLLLQEKGLQLTCIDASATMVKLCNDKGLKAIEGDLLTLPFNDNAFDGVWAYTSLLHVLKKDIGKAVSEIRRVLKKDGVFGLGLIEGEGESYRESSGVGKPRWFAYYTEVELTNLLKKHQFEILYFEDFIPSSKRYLNYISKKL